MLLLKEVCSFIQPSQILKHSQMKKQTNKTKQYKTSNRKSPVYGMPLYNYSYIKA